MRDCAICKHAHRVEIEAALFKVSPDNAEMTMPRIASEFEVPEDALKTHALFHTSFNMEPNGDSIVRQIKMREADMLLATAMEQMSTMQAAGMTAYKIVKEKLVMIKLNEAQIRELINRYPYLLPRNVWTGKVVEDYDYSYILGQYEIPWGWFRLFLLYCKNIRELLEKANYLNKFQFTQIKEKKLHGIQPGVEFTQLHTFFIILTARKGNLL